MRAARRPTAVAAVVACLLSSCSNTDSRTSGAPSTAESSPVGTPDPTSTVSTAPEEPVDDLVGEECYLSSLMSFRALVQLSRPPTPAGGIAVEYLGGALSPLLELSISQVIAAGDGALSTDKEIVPGATLEVAVYGEVSSDDAKTSPVGLAMLEADPLASLVALYADPFGGAKWVPQVLMIESDRIGVGPNSCEHSRTLELFFEALGEPPTVAALVELRTAFQSTCTEIPADQISRCEQVLNAAVEAVSPPPQPAPDWHDLDPSQRSIDIRFVPKDVVDDLVLLGVATTESGPVPAGTFTFSCELGQSLGWVSGQGLHVLPVSACRSSPLVLTFLGGIGDSPTVVGEIPPGEFNVETGIEVLVTASTDGQLSVDTRALAGGELERLLGIDAATLEQLREQYSTNTAE